MNTVSLVGRLTRDVELRYTGNGIAVGSFTVAVNRQYKDQNGERGADFINCVIWRKSAENFANFTHKGSLVAIEGRIQTRNYENQQGQRVYVTEVVVNNFTLLETRAESERYRREHGNQNSAPSYQSMSSDHSYGGSMSYGQNNYGAGSMSQGMDNGYGYQTQRSYNGNVNQGRFDQSMPSHQENANIFGSMDEAPAHQAPKAPAESAAQPGNPLAETAASENTIDIADDDLPF